MSEVFRASRTDPRKTKGCRDYFRNIAKKKHVRGKGIKKGEGRARSKKKTQGTPDT